MCVARDIERTSEELGGPLLGLLPPHLASRRCVSGMSVVMQLTVDNGEPLFEVEYEDY